LKETYVKTKHPTQFYENIMQKLDINYSTALITSLGIEYIYIYRGIHELRSERS